MGGLLKHSAKLVKIGAQDLGLQQVIPLKLLRRLRLIDVDDNFHSKLDNNRFPPTEAVLRVLLSNIFGTKVANTQWLIIKSRFSISSSYKMSLRKIHECTSMSSSIYNLHNVV